MRTLYGVGDRRRISGATTKAFAGHMPGANTAKDIHPVGEHVPNEAGFFTLIEQHRKTVLSTPFILAAILAVVYTLGGDEFRQVMDFFSPGHIFGR